MSVVLVIGSEEELTGGGPWCARLAELHAASICLLVLGTQRKALAEAARRRLSELVDTAVEFDVELVEADVAAVLGHAQAVDCQTLLIVYRSDGAKFQRQLFQRSSFATLWMRSDQPAPVSSDQVVALFGRPNLITTLTCERLFGFAPGATLCERADREPDQLVVAASAAIKAKRVRPGALVLCGIEDADNSEDPIYQAGLALLRKTSSQPMALAHRGDSMTERLAARVRDLFASIAPPLQREQRLQLAQDLQSGSQPNLEFLGLMSAAAMLAAFGLIQDSAAVIIGAMLIAPLMTPILGAGLALTQGNWPLFRSAIHTIGLGFLGAIVASMLFGKLFWLLEDPSGVEMSTSEMGKRCRPSWLDFCVGFVGGVAASYARTRSHLSSALAGAAIAAALVPPISTAGLQIVFLGYSAPLEQGTRVVGPLILVCINVLTIMAGSWFVLWSRGMRTDRSQDRPWAPRAAAVIAIAMIGILVYLWQR